jgi:peptide-methionine (S)-S-oxide reductase
MFYTKLKILLVTFAVVLTFENVQSINNSKPMNEQRNELKTVTLAAGCFWCVEAVFQNLKGVEKVVSGYSGGHVKKPSYREVCNGTTGHAEAIQLHYNPSEISFEQILDVFWKTHDPTTLNRQGPDIGTQYRSVIFYHNDEQKRIAEDSKNQMNRSGYFNKPIVTAIEPYKNFFVAEENHQNFYKNNPNQPYCRFRIDPKIDKLQKQFNDLLK